ncbi:MAG: hypothetical protein A2Y25_03985 [Candidatus Melainabacteria bacterium GWF2_37_15]|nr:MAG: hypothetical protein A2Y25_03985 [Candidatus Melainabacteria bacterium GWF2_37_15]
MNKNFKVFQIHGLTGLLFVMLIMAGLCFGFILFPIWAIMMGWNGMIGNLYNGPLINYYQASLLWVFIALCVYLFLKNSITIKIHTSESLDEDNIKKIIEEEESNKDN